jgi:hypothetical protein
MPEEIRKLQELAENEPDRNFPRSSITLTCWIDPP